MANKQHIRRYKYTYDDTTVKFDVGDVITTKYGDIDKIVSIDPESHIVTFVNIEPLDWSRISYRHNDKLAYQEMEDHYTHVATIKGFKTKSIVTFVENNNIVEAEVVNLVFNSHDCKMYCNIQLKNSETTILKEIKELKIKEIFKTTKEKVESILRKHLPFGAFNHKEDNDELVNELVKLIDGRNYKINRIIDEL